MKTLQEYLPQDFKPVCGFILGSGLSDLLKIDVLGAVPFSEIKGYHSGHVIGHNKRCVWGHYQAVPVVVHEGRAHLYEGASFDQLKAMVRSFKDVGCEHVVITNAVGSLNADVGPGDIAVIKDHLNLQGISPLMGPNDEAYGPRFVGLEGAYDEAHRALCLDIAKQAGIPCKEAVYTGVLGPHYETPAEIQAFSRLGGDVVGMSTVAEVIVARHCGLRVLTLSAISNFASGVSDAPIEHDQVVFYAEKAAHKLIRIIDGWLSKQRA